MNRYTIIATLFLLLSPGTSEAQPIGTGDFTLHLTDLSQNAYQYGLPTELDISVSTGADERSCQVDVAGLSAAGTRQPESGSCHVSFESYWCDWRFHRLFPANRWCLDCYQQSATIQDGERQVSFQYCLYRDDENVADLVRTEQVLRELANRFPD